MHVPFVEQLLVAVLFGVLAPGAWGVSLLSRGRVIEGAIVIAGWAALFGWLSLYLHRRNRIRLWVSVPSAVLVLIACAVVFFSP